jgi:hypothetical protein
MIFTWVALSCAMIDFSRHLDAFFHYNNLHGELAALFTILVTVISISSNGITKRMHNAQSL